MRNRNRRLPLIGVAAGFLLATAPGGLLAQRAEPLKPKELIVSPAEQPSPALQYRLMPISSELNPGDARPVYLRLRNELGDQGWNQIAETSASWLSTPLDKLPVGEARKFVDQWGGKSKLLRIGTRREHCDWSYELPE